MGAYRMEGQFAGSLDTLSYMMRKSEKILILNISLNSDDHGPTTSKQISSEFKEYTISISWWFQAAIAAIMTM